MTGHAVENHGTDTPREPWPLHGLFAVVGQDEVKQTTWFRSSLAEAEKLAAGIRAAGNKAFMMTIRLTPLHLPATPIVHPTGDAGPRHGSVTDGAYAVIGESEDNQKIWIMSYLYTAEEHAANVRLAGSKAFVMRLDLVPLAQAVGTIPRAVSHA